MIDYELVSRALYRKLTDLVLEADGRSMKRPYTLSAADAYGRTVFDATLRPHGRPKLSTDQGDASTHLPLNILLRSADGQWITDTLTESEFPAEVFEPQLDTRSGHLKVVHRSGSAPYLISRLGKKHCSVCGVVFEKSSSPSVTKAFAEHLKTVHDPAALPVPAGPMPDSDVERDQQPKPEWARAVDDLLAKTNKHLFEFLGGLIMIASSLADMAQKCTDRKIALRSGDEAFKGYQTALEFLQRQNLPAEEHRDLAERMEPLKAQLIQLGKIIPARQTALTG